MPDPRLPQRPGSRQPAPQKGQPQDPKAGSGRLVRPLPPEQQTPTGEFERKIRKGETYWVVGCDDIPEPRKAKVIRLSNEPGHAVCVEFEEPIGGTDEKSGEHWGVTHDGGGLGKMGHCLFVRPDQVVDDKLMEAHKAHAADQEAAPTYDEYEELSVNPQPSQPGSIEVLDEDEDK